MIVFEGASPKPVYLHIENDRAQLLPADEKGGFILRTLAEGLPIAAQLDWDLSEADDVDPASTRAPNATGPTVRPMLQRPGASP